MGWFAWLFVFALGFAVGALLSWLYTRYVECPALASRPAEGLEAVDVALRERRGRLEVYSQGRWYGEAKKVPEEVLHHMQRRSLQWLRWLKAGETVAYAPGRPAPARTPPRESPASEEPDPARMYAQIEVRARQLLGQRGLRVLLRLVPQGPGVVIRVNDQVYQRVDDIPDPRIREVLREAVRSWEADLRRKRG